MEERHLNTSLDPATDEVLGSIPEMGVEEAQAAIDSAGEAFKTWSKTTAKERHDALGRLFRLMGEHSDDLARIMVSWTDVNDGTCTKHIILRIDT
jgi:succinate-semialdehyde dehydrogenase / glutarate-semialdehyde dehydrogenase